MRLEKLEDGQRRLENQMARLLKAIEAPGVNSSQKAGLCSLMQGHEQTVDSAEYVVNKPISTISLDLTPQELAKLVTVQRAFREWRSNPNPERRTNRKRMSLADVVVSARPCRDTYLLLLGCV